MRIWYVAIAGGLGNQMFQYAYFLYIKSLFKNARLFIPSKDWEHSSGFELGNVFGVNYEPCVWERLYHLGFPFTSLFHLTHKTYMGRSFKVMTEDLCPGPKYRYFYGTWQSQKYFSNPEIIRNVFRFDDSKLSAQTKSVAMSLQKAKVTCSVHIRRGDYLSSAFANGFGSCCPPSYYREGMELIKDRLGEVVFVFFSDDMPWVKDNLACENAIYVDHNVGNDSWQDMYLMSQCSHNIIANSTFSWWGAWLNDNKDKIVIAPHRWWSTIEVNDVVPDSWIRI